MAVSQTVDIPFHLWDITSVGSHTAWKLGPPHYMKQESKVSSALSESDDKIHGLFKSLLL